MQALHFYDAQQAGRMSRLPARRVPWRQDAFVVDGYGADGKNMAGGWFDAGAHDSVTSAVALWACTRTAFCGNRVGAGVEP